MDWTSLDVAYAVRQNALVAALTFAPAIVWAMLRNRRWLFLIVAPAWVLLSAWLFSFTVTDFQRLWPDGGVPYKPFRMGPSALTVREMSVHLVAINIIGAGAVWLAVLTWRRWRGRPASSPYAAIGGLVAFLVYSAFLTTLIVVVGESSHEDTIVAPGFTLATWDQLALPKTRSELHAALGPPLHRQCRGFGPNTECWATNFSAGYFAVVWYDGDDATRIYRWYSD